MENKLNYKSAVEELTQIQQRLKGDVQDLDRLLADVNRAKFLIAWCNERLDEVESSLMDILEEGYDQEE